MKGMEFDFWPVMTHAYHEGRVRLRIWSLASDSDLDDRLGMPGIFGDDWGPR
jgi:hypothetical protein